MKISAQGMTPVFNAQSVAPAAPVAATGAHAAVAGSAAGGAGPLASAVLGPARAALQALPDVDEARVAELRDALAKGELPFDAGKLAGLIQRYHGGHG